MKKSILLVMLAVLLMFSTISVQAQETEIQVELNGEILTMDQSPAILEGRILVPVRVIFEALGAEIQWIPETKTIIAARDDIEVILVLGSKIALVNNEEVALDVAAQTISGRTMVPARFAAESLKANVDWESEAKKIVIRSEETTETKEIVKMIDYHPLNAASVNVFGGHIDEEYYVRIRFQPLGKEVIDDREVYMLQRSLQLTETDTWSIVNQINNIHLFASDLQEEIMFIGEIDLDNYGELIWFDQPRWVYPSFMEINKPYEYVRDDGGTVVSTIKGYETIVLPHITFDNALKLEEIIYENGELAFIEKTYFAKEVGAVKFSVQEYIENEITCMYELTYVEL